MNNKNAIVIKKKKKMIQVTKEYNRDTGEPEEVWKEGGTIFKRLPLRTPPRKKT